MAGCGILIQILHMKIAFYDIGYRLSKGNGVVSQALTWKKGLESLGHEVTLCNSWDYYPLEEYDAIQIFGFNENIADFVNALSQKNRRIFIAPILDPNYGIMKAKLMSLYGSHRFRLSSRYSSLRDCRKCVKGILVRSEFEKTYMIEAYNFKPELCHIVKLPSGITPQFPFHEKEDFCLHISLLCDARKNVKRLIDASVKYKFPLVLAGGLRNEKEKQMLAEWMRGKSNIKYLGWITEEQKKDLYQRARVFALPSINEGVGIVALEASCYGADIVITKLGGPKEYYIDRALKVNPYSIDEIGRAVKWFMDGNTYQPQLAEHIHSVYSLDVISNKLENIYNIK